jgi:hypothetical protein
MFIVVKFADTFRVFNCGESGQILPLITLAPFAVDVLGSPETVFVESVFDVGSIGQVNFAKLSCFQVFVSGGPFGRVFSLRSPSVSYV